MKKGDLVRYKTGTVWSAEDLFIVLKVSNHKKTWHRQIWLYNRHVDTGSIVVSWDEREIMEVISEAD